MIPAGCPLQLSHWTKGNCHQMIVKVTDSVVQGVGEKRELSIKAESAPMWLQGSSDRRFLGEAGHYYRAYPLGSFKKIPIFQLKG